MVVATADSTIIDSRYRDIDGNKEYINLIEDIYKYLRISSYDKCILVSFEDIFKINWRWLQINDDILK